MKRRILTILMLTLLCGTLPGCSREPDVKGPQLGTIPSSAGVPVYHLAIHPADLKGKSVSYPSSTTLAACIMPQLLATSPRNWKF